VVGDEPCVTIDFIPTGDTVGGRVGRCPCGVESRVATDDQLDHLVAAIREHAKGSHDHEVSRESVLAELGVSPATHADGQDDAAAVRTVIEAYGHSLRLDDADAAVDLFTAAAAIMADGFPAAVGQAQITDIYTSALASAGMDYTYEFDQVETRGDTAVARTRSSGTTTARASGRTSPGRYRELFVLRREQAGWKISAYMYQPQPEAA
jgi:ketosteroid isomerase-like protein